ncbi:MAG: cation:proton antiporter [Spirochaetia bacterium]|nr:cation:proton antiporter [Spirochaetia bacterium]
MEEHSSTILHDIALSIIFAAGAAHLGRFLKLPPLIGYIAAGIILGTKIGFGFVESHTSIELISEMGLIFLLFIIGLELNPREVMKMGKRLILPGVIQFVINAAIGMTLFYFYQRSTWGPFAFLYLGVVLSFGSTLIVVKLLHDKFEIKTLSGQFTLSVLIIQDIWAVVFMGLQQNLSNPQILPILYSLGSILMVLAGAFVISRYILSYIFTAAAKKPELVLLTAVAWSFLVAGTGSYFGVSVEMGALIAGVSIAAYPYSAEVVARLGGVRDFFVTLFFVALGMKIPIPTYDVLIVVALLVLYIYASRFLSLVPVFKASGEGSRTGILVAVNLSQISEFALVILALGVGFGHVTDELLSIVLTAIIATSILSSYSIQGNEFIARSLGGLFYKIGSAFSKEAQAPEQDGTKTEKPSGHGEPEVFVLGYFRIARGFVEALEKQNPQIKEKVAIVDYNVKEGDNLKGRGYNWHYGDLANPDTLEHAGLHSAQTIIVTISDTFLKGITTSRLLFALKRMAPGAKIIMIGEDDNDARTLTEQGAADVLLPGEITGQALYRRVFAAD